MVQMSNRICLFLFSSFILLGHASASSCADLSGDYSAPWDTESNKTTFSFSQNACDYLIIVGATIDYEIPSSTVYHSFTAKLDGRSPSENASNPGGACWGVAPNVCASYKAQSSFVIKTLPKQEPGMTFSTSHGMCFFLVSHLSKDNTGSLIEIPQAYSCEDGYVGPLAPIVFPLANNK